jgi:hypothetical protein
MVTFTIPINDKHRAGKKQVFSFSVLAQSVMLAGSRHLELPPLTSRSLVHKLYAQGFGFFVGCADGVDRSIRKALIYYPYYKRTFVACAFHSRTAPEHTFGLFASVVVPEKIPYKAALARRTVWMARRCQLLILFPIDPLTGKWGKGSTLAFNTATLNLKPVFVVADSAPPKSHVYNVFAGNLFDLVNGFWVVPHPYSNGGLCEDEI